MSNTAIEPAWFPAGLEPLGLEPLQRADEPVLVASVRLLADSAVIESCSLGEASLVHYCGSAGPMIPPKVVLTIGFDAVPHAGDFYAAVITPGTLPRDACLVAELSADAETHNVACHLRITSFLDLPMTLTGTFDVRLYRRRVFVPPRDVALEIIMQPDRAPRDQQQVLVGRVPANGCLDAFAVALDDCLQRGKNVRHVLLDAAGEQWRWNRRRGARSPRRLNYKQQKAL
jgi:hypothetical protein